MLAPDFDSEMTPQPRPPAWNVLDASSPWMQEFTSALNKATPTVGWIPSFSWVGLFKKRFETLSIADPPLNGFRFPLQRGYARKPIKWLNPLGGSLISSMLSHFGEPRSCPLVCTAPFYVPVAAKWPGPVVYYSTDLTSAYDGVDPHQVLALDRELCSIATAICPNSQRIADYFISEAGCHKTKITVIPNATRSINLRDSPVQGPDSLPASLHDLPRPIAGVIGNLSSNMDWLLLRETVRRTPWLQWAFIGPTTMKIPDLQQAAARADLMGMGGRVRFAGSQHYGALQSFARCFDVAVLPYTKREPTYSGSSTRFYEHQAALRPMVSTRGFEELLHKEPLLKLVDNSEEMADYLEHLRQRHFTDGYESMRWLASKEGTWENRAETMRLAVSRTWRG